MKAKETRTNASIYVHTTSDVPRTGFNHCYVPSVAASIALIAALHNCLVSSVVSISLFKSSNRVLQYSHRGIEYPALPLQTKFVFWCTCAIQASYSFGLQRENQTTAAGIRPLKNLSRASLFEGQLSRALLMQLKATYVQSSKPSLVRWARNPWKFRLSLLS